MSASFETNYIKFATPADTQNLLLWSEDMSNAVWNKANIDITVNQANDIDGQPTLDEADYQWSNSNMYQQLAVTASTQYVFSWEAKRGTATAVTYRIYDSTHYSYIIAATDYYASINASTPVRISVPFTTPSGCLQVRLSLLYETVLTDGTVYVGRAQLRLNSHAEGYVKTEGATHP